MGIRSFVRGTLLSFDRHCNIVLSNAIEACWLWVPRLVAKNTQKKRVQSASRREKRAQKQREFQNVPPTSTLPRAKPCPHCGASNDDDLYESSIISRLGDNLKPTSVFELAPSPFSASYDPYNYQTRFPSVEHLIIPQRDENRHQKEKEKTWESVTHNGEANDVGNDSLSSTLPTKSIFAARMEQRELEKMKAYNENIMKLSTDSSQTVDPTNTTHVIFQRDQTEPNDELLFDSTRGSTLDLVSLGSKPSLEEVVEEDSMTVESEFPCDCAALVARKIGAVLPSSVRSQPGHWIIHVSQKPLLMVQGQHVSSISLSRDENDNGC